MNSVTATSMAPSLPRSIIMIFYDYDVIFCNLVKKEKVTNVNGNMQFVLCHFFLWCKLIDREWCQFNAEIVLTDTWLFPDLLCFEQPWSSFLSVKEKALLRYNFKTIFLSIHLELYKYYNFASAVKNNLEKSRGGKNDFIYPFFCLLCFVPFDVLSFLLL